MKRETKPRKIDPEKELPRVQNLLYQLAWRAKNLRLPFEEAKGEAYFAFMLACRSFDPSRGMKFSSWVYFKVRNHLRTTCTRGSRDPLVFVEINDEVCGAAPSNRKEFLEMLEDLSAEARELIHLLIELPGEILNDPPTSPRHLLARVCEYLGFRRGLDDVAQDIRVNEIRHHFYGGSISRPENQNRLLLKQAQAKIREKAKKARVERALLLWG